MYRLIYQVKVVIAQYLYLTARSVPALIQTRSVPAFIQSIQTRSVPLFKNGDRPQFSEFQHKKWGQTLIVLGTNLACAFQLGTDLILLKKNQTGFRQFENICAGF